MSEEETKQLAQAYAELKEAYAILKEGSEQKDRRIEELEGLLIRAVLHIEELEKRLAKDSHNSSKPPSSDGLVRKMKRRPPSGKSTGGQAGHPGHTLQQVAEPDQVVTHRPSHCAICHRELQEIPGRTTERRQVHELPEVRVQVTEHRVEAICCPTCGHLTVASFPHGVDTPAQYGPRLRAVAVYLSQFQLLPLSRIGEVFADMWACPLSEATVVRWIAQAARTLDPTMQLLKQRLLATRVNHVDETGIRIKGLLRWVHVTATKWLTVYNWHPKRGQEAMNAIGVLPRYQGRAMHDRLSSYDQYSCQHSVCGAHLLRDCLFVAEHEKQPCMNTSCE